MNISALTFIYFLTTLLSTTHSLYSSACTSQSATRLCTQGDNATQYLLNIKKGGSNILSTSDYNANFFTCQEYTYDCGYVQRQEEALSIANGIELQMTELEVDQILPLNNTLANRIKPYLNLSAEDATCGQKIFPLVLTAEQSTLFFTNYMNILIPQITTKYNTEKESTSLVWSDLNVNIKTAVAMVIKEDQTLMQGTFWTLFKENDFVSMSLYLKALYQQNNQVYLLHSAYLIDSVTQVCNKYQSVNFLIDQSGSITPPNFQLGQDFLTQYFTNTFDAPQISSIHYFDTTFQQYLSYGNTQQQLLDGITAKPYRALGTYTGLAINSTVDLIQAANFDSGIPKILIVMTDGKSTDSVLEASDYARSKGITLISVGIGSGVNTTQLLQIAETASNVINVVSYSDLGKLVDFIANYFCKQIINVGLGQTIVNNVVRVPESPSYFRVQKSLTDFYQLNVDYETNPENSGQQLHSSEYDPFPDLYTDFVITELYRPSATQRVYFVEPVQNVSIRIKKEKYEQRQITNSYVSVGGNNLKFNISLMPCSSSLCLVQRQRFSDFGTKSNSEPTEGQDYNIYTIIIASILGLICSAALGIGALKKFYGQQQTIDQLKKNGIEQKIQPQMTEHDINQNEDDHNSSKNKQSKNNSCNNQNSDEEEE